ncbi:MAG: hypothetical protein GY798_26440 [Hyphomicrobiales bacterium]|nr:hypothetical protein [Hyphomicrobiales bacterium]
MTAAVPYRSILSIAWKVALLIGVVVAARYAGDWVMSQLAPHLTPTTGLMLHRLIIASMAIYILLLIIPFVPGVEIGLAMMVMLGPEIAPIVYVGTVTALVLAFLIGRLVPQRLIIRAFDAIRLKRAADLLRQLQPLSVDERLQFILQRAPYQSVPVLLRFRFLGLVAALNLPGNAVLGGGGGICMMAGFCRLFPLPGFVLAVAVAVAPVPLIVYFVG